MRNYFWRDDIAEDVTLRFVELLVLGLGLVQYGIDSRKYRVWFTQFRLKQSCEQK